MSWLVGEQVNYNSNQVKTKLFPGNRSDIIHQYTPFSTTQTPINYFKVNMSQGSVLNE